MATKAPEPIGSASHISGISATPRPYAVANANLLAEAIEDGWGDEDIIGVARLLERATAAGLSI